MIYESGETSSRRVRVLGKRNESNTHGLLSSSSLASRKACFSQKMSVMLVLSAPVSADSL